MLSIRVLRAIFVALAGVVLAGCTMSPPNPLPSGERPRTGDAFKIGVAELHRDQICKTYGAKSAPCADAEDAVADRQRDAQRSNDKRTLEHEKRIADDAKRSRLAIWKWSDNLGCHYTYDGLELYKSQPCQDRNIPNDAPGLVIAHGERGSSSSGRTTERTDERDRDLYYPRERDYESTDRGSRRSLEVEIDSFHVPNSHGKDFIIDSSNQTVTEGDRPVATRMAGRNKDGMYQFELYLVTYDGQRVYICRDAPQGENDAFDFCTSVHASSDSLGTGGAVRRTEIETMLGWSEGSVPVRLSRPFQEADVIVDHRDSGRIRDAYDRGRADRSRY